MNEFAKKIIKDHEDRMKKLESEALTNKYGKYVFVRCFECGKNKTKWYLNGKFVQGGSIDYDVEHFG